MLILIWTQLGGIWDMIRGHKGGGLRKTDGWRHYIGLLELKTEKAKKTTAHQHTTPSTPTTLSGCLRRRCHTGCLMKSPLPLKPRLLFCWMRSLLVLDTFEGHQHTTTTIRQHSTTHTLTALDGRWDHHSQEPRWTLDELIIPAYSLVYVIATPPLISPPPSLLPVLLSTSHTAHLLALRIAFSSILVQDRLFSSRLVWDHHSSSRSGLGSPLLLNTSQDHPLLLETGPGSPLLLKTGPGSPLLLKIGLGWPSPPRDHHWLLEIGWGSPLLLETGPGSPLLLKISLGYPLLLEIGPGSPLLLEIGLDRLFSLRSVWDHLFSSILVRISSSPRDWLGIASSPWDWSGIAIPPWDWSEIASSPPWDWSRIAIPPQDWFRMHSSSSLGSPFLNTGPGLPLLLSTGPGSPLLLEIGLESPLLLKIGPRLPLLLDIGPGSHLLLITGPGSPFLLEIGQEITAHYHQLGHSPHHLNGHWLSSPDPHRTHWMLSEIASASEITLTPPFHWIFQGDCSWLCSPALWMWTACITPLTSTLNDTVLALLLYSCPLIHCLWALSFPHSTDKSVNQEWLCFSIPKYCCACLSSCGSWVAAVERPEREEQNEGLSGWSLISFHLGVIGMNKWDFNKCHITPIHFTHCSLSPAGHSHIISMDIDWAHQTLTELTGCWVRLLLPLSLLSPSLDLSRWLLMTLQPWPVFGCAQP